jgi:hypothetical protein
LQHAAAQAKSHHHGTCRRRQRGKERKMRGKEGHAGTPAMRVF